MLVTTLTVMPEEYEPIGLVTVSMKKLKSTNPDSAKDELIKKAKALGADAIYGFNFQIMLGALNLVEQVAYGTAVKKS